MEEPAQVRTQSSRRLRWILVGICVLTPIVCLLPAVRAALLIQSIRNAGGQALTERATVHPLDAIMYPWRPIVGVIGREGGARFTHGLLRSIRQFPRLQLVVVEDDQFIDDESMRILADLPGLNRLHIKGTHVTDAGLEHIAKMKNLRVLELDIDQFSTTALDRLRQQRPDLKIVNDFDIRNPL